MTHTSDTSQLALDYHKRQQCSKQWSCFLSVFFSELMASAGQEDGGAFLRHIGRCMAGELALADHQTLDELEADINRHWRDMNWGEIRLEAEDKAIRITHCAYPLPVQSGDQDTGRDAVAAVLEGVYAAWLEGQGGESNVPLQLTGADDNVLEFVYGKRHAAE